MQIFVSQKTEIKITKTDDTVEKVTDEKVCYHANMTKSGQIPNIHFFQRSMPRRQQGS